MPTYSYACRDCDNAFDIQQAFSDDVLTVCPECGGTLRKRYGSVGVVFKGSGFYRTDSRKGSVAAASTGKDKDSGAASGTSGSSESTSSSTSSSSSNTSSTGSSKAAATA